MIYSDNYEKKIGFDKIKQFVADFCLSEMGRIHTKNIRFSDVFSDILNHLDYTDELHDILTSDEPFPSDDYFNVIPELTRISTKGTYIEIEKMIDFKFSYSTIQDILIYFKQREEKYPSLNILASEILYYPEIIRKIELILDEKGKIRDDASEELQKIRKSLSAVQIQIEKRTRQILLSLKKENIVNPDIEMTVRNGRCVIPVSSSNKRKIKGFIHDESATGQTIFIEPAEIFELNNKLRELESAETKEIIKILIVFTDFIRPYLNDLFKAYNFLGEIDFIRAKALLAIETNSIKPKLLNHSCIDWHRAINPVLFLHFKEKKKDVVPYDIRLNSKQRILVISGPNAGGKSVCLKTIGLLQYMLQCGFLIPVKDGSEAGIFSDIFIEIGDEQSIENDLSTYSSHLINLKFFIENAKNNTLFLIDEFGSGTEPVLGGAIAEATLNELNKKESFGAVTTHYANLKEFAARTEGVLNGSMLFDTTKMLPLFKLNIGNPGSSYALEIADNIGFPKHVIENAMNIAGEEKISFEKQIRLFETEKEELAKQQEKIKIADEFFSEMIDKYQNLLSELESDRKSIITEAKQQASLLLLNTNKTIENTIRQIKEAGAEKEKTKQLRNELIEFKEQIISEPETKKIKLKKLPTLKRPENIIKTEKIIKTPQKGSFVKIPGQKSIGEIIELVNGQAQVLYNNMKIQISVTQLEVVERSEYQLYINKKTKSNFSEIYENINDKVASFKTTLDVRGKKAEEITEIIEKYMDDALLLKIYYIRILHGKGSGVLRKIIHEILSRHKNVVSFDNEHVENGGDGITVVSLK